MQINYIDNTLQRTSGRYQQEYGNCDGSLPAFAGAADWMLTLYDEDGGTRLLVQEKEQAQLLEFKMRTDAITAKIEWRRRLQGKVS